MDVFQQATTFLELASSAGLEVGGEEEPVLQLGETLLQITRLQGEIARAVVEQQGSRLEDRFQGLTSLQWLLHHLTSEADQLAQLSTSCGQLQLQLSQPAVSNSVPCLAAAQGPLLALTTALGEVVARGEVSLAAVRWVGGQEGERGRQGGHLLDRAVAHLRGEVVGLRGLRARLEGLLGESRGG